MNKEIEIKHEALESLVVGMTENINKMQENKQDTIQKNRNKSNYKKITMQKEFLSAILHDKKRFDNGVMVLNDGTVLLKLTAPSPPRRRGRQKPLKKNFSWIFLTAPTAPW